MGNAKVFPQIYHLQGVSTYVTGSNEVFISVYVKSARCLNTIHNCDDGFPHVTAVERCFNAPIDVDELFSHMSQLS